MADQEANDPDFAGLVQAMINAANAAADAAGLQAPPAPPAAPVPFALVPGMLNDLPLNFEKASDVKLFNKGIQGVEPKFDMKEENLHVFLAKLKEHVRIHNWHNIVTIPDTAGVNRNLLTQYGQLTPTNCTNHARTYIGQQTRAAQNSMMFYQCLVNSLTEEASLSVMSNCSPFTIDETPSGTCFLKTIIGKASVDTRQKVLLLRETVSNLHVKMVDLGGDVEKFNVYVDNVRDALAGRGQSVDELTMHLFKAYSKVNDEEFQNFLRNKRDLFDTDDEGDVLQADQLMRAALNKYILIKQRSATDSLSVQDPSEKIIALEAQLKALKGTTDAGNNSNNKRRGRNGKKRDDANYAWKKVAPKENEPKVKTVSGKKYNWCPKHSAWTVHTAAECSLKVDDSTSGKDTSTDERMVLNRAYAAILNDE
jgi:hypothetical protein